MKVRNTPGKQYIAVRLPARAPLSLNSLIISVNTAPMQNIPTPEQKIAINDTSRITHLYLG
jgi:hypothetical protein